MTCVEKCRRVVDGVPAAGVAMAAAVIAVGIGGCSGQERVQIPDQGTTDRGAGDLGAIPEGFVTTAPKQVGRDSTGIPVVKGELLLLARPGTTAEQVRAAVSATSGAVVGRLTRYRLYLLKYSTQAAAEPALKALVKHNVTAAVAANRVFSTTAPPSYRDDPLYAYDPLASSTHVEGSWWVDAARIPPAWLIDVGADGTGQTVAVIDGGFFKAHEELAGRVHPSSQIGSAHFHGTAVAGAAAMGDNTVGGIGTAPGATLLLYGITFSLSNFASTLATIVQNKKTLGDPVAVNCSFGIDWPAEFAYRGWLWPPNAQQQAWMKQQITAVQAVFSAIMDDFKTNDMLLVHSAGNDNYDYQYYDMFGAGAGKDAVTVVGAVGKDGNRASFSNYGASVHLAAPGVNMLLPCDVGSTTTGLCDDVVSSGGSTYEHLSGTSFSAPLVTGAVALLAQINPSLTMQQIKDLLTKTADPISTAGATPVGGRLNLWKAALSAKNGGLLASPPPSGFIKDTQWYGVEILNTDADIQDIYLGDKATKITKPHHNVASTKRTRVRFSVKGAALKAAQSTLVGLDDKTNEVLRRKDLTFTDPTPWDDYVYPVTNTWHIVTADLPKGCGAGTADFTAQFTLQYQNEDGVKEKAFSCTYQCKSGKLEGCYLFTPKIAVKSDRTVHISSYRNHMTAGKITKVTIDMVKRDPKGAWSSPATVVTLKGISAPNYDMAVTPGN